jgi:hypothetical protein
MWRDIGDTAPSAKISVFRTFVQLDFTIVRRSAIFARSTGGGGQERPACSAS